MWKGSNKSALKGKKIFNDLCICLGVAGQGCGATDTGLLHATAHRGWGRGGSCLAFSPSPLYPVPRRVLCPPINPGAPARCSQPHRCRISAHGHPLQGPRRAATSPSPVITGDKGVITGDKGFPSSSPNAPLHCHLPQLVPAWRFGVPEQDSPSRAPQTSPPERCLFNTHSVGRYLISSWVFDTCPGFFFPPPVDPACCQGSERALAGLC